MKVPLTQGAYSARSIIADAQRCVNIFPETNPSDSPFPVTHYPTAGTTLLFTLPTAPVRGMYVTTTGVLLAAAGNTIYQCVLNVDKTWTNTALGTLQTLVGVVSMQDNGTTCVIVDGSPFGWTIDLTTPTASSPTPLKMVPIVDAAFYGSRHVDILDGFLIFVRVRTDGPNEMYITGADAVTFDPLDFTTKNGYPDSLQLCPVVHREIWLIGTDTTEIWFDTGDPTFTFGRMPGVFIQHGIVAFDSLAKQSNNLFWLSRDPQGQGVAVVGTNYEVTRISTHAIEQEWAGYARIDDAIGYTWQMFGHVFWVLNFPTADKTWVYDQITGQWHEWAFRDDQGLLHRHRGNCYAFFSEMSMVGDFETGDVFKLDPTVYTDNGKLIERIRGFPHLMDDQNNARIMYREFIAAMEVGNGPTDGSYRDPQVRLRWSDDAGRSWSNWIMSGAGAPGQYLRNIQYQRLGMARERVFELSWSEPIRTALNGAYVQFQTAGQ